mmetsp:Transcript_52508/g.64327  ORF Transcript_52508/g.64327 Transcript_52508/m.64327 type:complete len:466 (-) Transcript_52508:15-1412(-)
MMSVGLCFILFICLSFSAKFHGTADLLNDKSGGNKTGGIQGFSFLGKFCYGYSTAKNTTHVPKFAAGIVTMNFDYIGYDPTNNNINDNEFYILFYDDETTSWPQLYNENLTCQEALDSSNQWHIKRKITFETSSIYDEIDYIWEYFRPRWWWVYLVKCDNPNAKIDFDILFEQNVDSIWYRQAGSNEKGLNTLYLVYLILYLILFGIQLYAYHIYRIQQYIHQIIKLLTSTIGFALFAVLFNFVDWMIFTETGEHELFFPIIAKLCTVTASTIFLLLLLVLSQGWTISRFEVAYPKLLLFVIIIVFISQCTFYIIRLIGLDPESTVYFYNSVPAIGIGVLFIVIGICFIIQCVFSIMNEPVPQKKRLYAGIMIYFIWFMFPLLQILIGKSFHEWMRDIAIISINITVETIAFIIMMILMWPSWAHQYFNLSMKDTQLSILENDSVTVNHKTAGQRDYQVLEQDRL